MELRHLRYFVAVAEEQNVTQAAKRLHLSQPPLSRQIHDLETEMGLALFERDANTIRLTKAGRIFLLEARAVLQRAEDAVSFTKSMANRKQSRIRVGSFATPTVEIIPRALRAFQRTNPEVTVNLRSILKQDVSRALRSGEVDVSFAVYGSPEDFHGLSVEPVGTYPLRVAVHKTHRFARLREVPMTELAKQTILGCRGQTKLFLPDTSGLKTVEEYDSVESLITGVETGRGVTIFYQVISRIAGGRLVLRPLKPSPQPPPIVLAYRKEAVSPTIAAFVACVRTAQLNTCAEPLARAELPSGRPRLNWSTHVLG
jgi:LysR family transcriptional regulator, benzoate and cis,cis-muconate-responsive activator of ben and cat genes